MENNVNAILAELNEEQKKAVQSLDGPVLIVAGAGSGKTRVLTSRVANLLAHGVEPSRVLALTFTKKAAGEMKERIALMVGAYKARRVVMGTFHSVFVRFLRQYAQSLGYPESFTIYDQSDSTSAVKTVIKELGLDDSVYKPRDVLARISNAKNNLITPEAYRTDGNVLRADAYAKKPRISDVYDLYQKRLKQSGVMDFDDILVNMNILFRDNPQALEEISSRFSHIMVDEYQDTNYSQYLILRKLAAKHHNLCVVGDDSQSIYAFRGAQIQNILNFRKDYPESKVFRLERNYRSTSTIVDAANSIIEHNTNRIPKKCYSQADEGEKIHVIKAYTEQDEAVEIVSEIQSRMRKDGAQYQDFAILYRTNAQSRALEEQLRRRNIPYLVYSGNSFFERAEVKDLMAYFKLCVNPSDDESFKRIVNKPARAIGDTTVKALEAFARANGVPLFRAVFLESLEATGLRGAAIQKLRAFCSMIDGFARKVPVTDAFELATEIAEASGLLALYRADLSIEGQARLANLEELVNSVAGFIEERDEEAEGAEDTFTLDDFLENVSLLSAVDVTDDDDTNNKVALMTAHSAKGLEFPYVFVAGMEENLFPGQNMILSLKDLEEERRLFYVAVTRAKKAVALSYAGTRMRNGRHESNAPSRFLRDIDSQYLDRPLEDEDFDNDGVRHEWGGFGSRWSGGRLDRFQRRTGDKEIPPLRSAPVGMTGTQKASSAVSRSSSAGLRSSPAGLRSSSSSSSGRENAGYGSVISSAGAAGVEKSPGKSSAPADPDFVPSPMTAFKPGMRIEHNRFGPGEILEITGVVPELKARVRFDELGEKLLLLKYAKMRPEQK
ncbi:MAG: UvrD-helicase domain-containing protein [Bacteroidales bacterium]|nr:UvrD-helicase domain-containing protein [Bacteroidales bacterium]